MFFVPVIMCSDAMIINEKLIKISQRLMVQISHFRWPLVIWFMLVNRRCDAYRLKLNEVWCLLRKSQKKSIGVLSISVIFIDISIYFVCIRIKNLNGFLFIHCSFIATYIMYLCDTFWFCPHPHSKGRNSYWDSLKFTCGTGVAWVALTHATMLVRRRQIALWSM